MITFVCFSNEHDYNPSKFHKELETCRICKVTRPTKRAADVEPQSPRKAKSRKASHR